MKTLRFSAIFGVAMLMLATLIAAPAHAASKGVIAFSQAAMENEARIQIQKDMEAHVRAAGFDFIWANAAGDPAKQLADVEDLLSRKPVLLIIAPVESEPLASVPDKCAKAGVPLLVIDRSIPGKAGTGSWLALLTNDFVEPGRIKARDMVAKLTKRYGSPKGTYVHITGQQGASPVVDEQKGIDDVMSKYPNIKCLATVDGRYQAEPSRKDMEDLLQRFPAGQIDAVYADSDTVGLGALEAIKTAGRTELLGWIWGRDGSKAWLQEMLNGNVAMTHQTFLYYGALAMKLFTEWQKTGKAITPPVYYATGEDFYRDTPQQIERVKARIKELDAMGVGCC